MPMPLPKRSTLALLGVYPQLTIDVIVVIVLYLYLSTRAPLPNTGGLTRSRPAAKSTTKETSRKKKAENKQTNKQAKRPMEIAKVGLVA